MEEARSISTAGALHDAIGGTPEWANGKIIGCLERHSIRCVAESVFAAIVVDDGEVLRICLGGGNTGFARAGQDSIVVPLDSFDDPRAVAGLARSAPRVGSLWMVPGLGETLRVNGRVGVRDDVLVVDVHEAFLHCANAFDRSGFWDGAGPLAVGPNDLVDELISASGFCLLGTVDAEGRPDLSPRGDPAGQFCQMSVDTRTLLVPDRPGNKMAASMHNLLGDPRVALAFLLPGSHHVVSVTGRASVSVDSRVLDRLAQSDRTPSLALVVDVAESRSEQSVAISRSHIWDSSTHVDRATWPSLTDMIGDQVRKQENHLDPVDEDEIEVVVQYRNRVGGDVLVLHLSDAQGAELPGWTPGAHIDLTPPDGIRRQYSLCGDPGERDRWRVAVRRDPAGRGGSVQVHDKMQIGTVARASRPRNHFPLEASGRYLFIAGGIGITAILPMLASADRDGADWRLLYLGRERSSMPFVEELGRYPGRCTLWPSGELGRIDLASAIGPPQDDVAIYLCGPPGLLQAVENHCRTWPAEALRVERFQNERPVRVDDSQIVVELRRSGITLTVGAGESILEVAKAMGVDVRSSCGNGVCGSCETPVLEGFPDHRDTVLSAAERALDDRMMICVSRGIGAGLVLDL